MVTMNKPLVGDTNWYQAVTDNWAAIESSGLQHIETKSVTGSPVTSLTFSNLDGDTDEIYVLKYSILKATTSAFGADIQPNGNTGNQKSERKYWGPAVDTHDSFSVLRFMYNGSSTTGDVESGTMIIHAKTGKLRNMMGYGQQTNPSPAITVYGMLVAMAWFETTTNITSLTINATVASGIDVGSKCSLYKLLRK